MDRKNLSRAYLKQVGLQQVVSDISEHRPPPPVRPVSAGGVIPGGAPAALTQEHLAFVDGTDEIPDRVFARLWGIITRMNSLTYIPDYADFERLQHGVTAVLISVAIEDEVNLKDYQQIAYYVGIQLRKSVKGIERKLISPVYSEVAHQELTSKSILEEASRNPAAAGLMSRIGSKMRMG